VTAITFAAIPNELGPGCAAALEDYYKDQYYVASAVVNFDLVGIYFWKACWVSIGGPASAN
jgi:hypothetical protein